MKLEQYFLYSLLGGIVFAILAPFLAWTTGASSAIIALSAVCGLVIGTPASAIGLYFLQSYSK